MAACSLYVQLCNDIVYVISNNNNLYCTERPMRRGKYLHYIINIILSDPKYESIQHIKDDKPFRNICILTNKLDNEALLNAWHNMHITIQSMSQVIAPNAG